MRRENKIKILMGIGNLIVLILAVFWAGLVSVEPNFILRIIFFAGGFGSTAFGLTLPLAWLIRSSANCQTSDVTGDKK